MSSTFARELRSNLTDAEQRLWYHLRRKQIAGARFRRQHPIGPYVADFFCADAKLIVEVDGGQHAEDSGARTAWLEALGYRVIRFWNNDVLSNTEAVLLLIVEALRATPLPVTQSRDRPPPRDRRSLLRLAEAASGGGGRR